MKKILTIGGAMYDTFLECHSIDMYAAHNKNDSSVIIPAGRKIELDTIVHYSGGGAVNSAISFSKLGFDVEAFFKIGDDKEGEFVVRALSQYPVHTSHLVKTDSAPTGHSFILPHPQGNRPIFIYRGANVTLQEADLPQQAIERADYVYVTSLSHQAAVVLLPLVQYAKKQNKHVVVNPGTSQLTEHAALLRQTLPFIDVLVLNRHEAELLMLIDNARTCFSLRNFFADIHASGPSIVVVTHGADGVYVSDTKMIYYHPSVRTKVVSTVGAGDAFCSTFVAHLWYDYSLEDALWMGIINSTSVINHLGAQTGLLSKQDFEKRFSLFDKNLVQKDPW